MTNSSTQAWLEAETAKYGPQAPLPQLVLELNQLFHAAEAPDYDQRHQAMHRGLSPQWAEMVAGALALTPQGPLRVLDFGCGTGFASLQVLNSLPPQRIERLVGFDPSPEMVQQCRRKVAAQFADYRVFSQLSEASAEGPFDLVLTNSVWHHLPAPWETLDELGQLLTPAALLLAGHEPSARFYANPHCLESSSALQQARQRDRRSSLTGRLLSQLPTWLGGTRRVSPKRQAARQAVKRGLFAKRPPAWLVDRLVDFHVPHSADEVNQGRGFDIQHIAETLRPNWRPVESRCYGHLAEVDPTSLPKKWQAENARLAQIAPDDGAWFWSLWQRQAETSQLRKTA